MRRRELCCALIVVGFAFAIPFWLCVREARENTSLPVRLSETSLARSDAWRRGADITTSAPVAEALDERVASDLSAVTRVTAEVDDPVERRRLLHAALKRWAGTAPEKAAEYALSLGEGEWQTALTAVIEGAVAHGRDALALAQALCRGDPEGAGDYGGIALAAFAQQQAHATAMQFALEDDSVHRSGWLQTALYHWGGAAPEEALQAARQLPAPADRRVAFDGLVAGWCAKDPAAVAAFAVTLPSSPERTVALQQSLPQWVSRDPRTAASWLRGFPQTEEFDAGATALASSTVLVEAAPETAIRWAASVTDPTMRANALHALATDLADKNADAVLHFIAATPGLPAADVSALLDGLARPPEA